MSRRYQRIDLFAGPGGWDEGLKMAGHAVDVGIEIDPDACATGRANGHPRRRGDVYGIDPARYRDDQLETDIIGSPPCGGLSKSGRGAGRDDLHQVIEALDETVAGTDRRSEHLMTMADHRSVLMIEPMRWLLATGARTLMLEQVPEALPVWDRYAEHLTDMGWSADTAVVDAADHGVPQNRRRALLAAHRYRAVKLPAPTHAKDGTGGLLPWVSMAQALGWENELVGFARRPGKRPQDADDELLQLDDGLFRARDLRTTDQPAQTLTEKVRSWKRRSFVANGVIRPNSAIRGQDEPAPTLMIGNGRPMWLDGDPDQWMPAAENVQARGIPVTPDEAGQLQSFPAGYRWCGTGSDQFQQIANAIPPLLAAAVARAVLG